MNPILPRDEYDAANRAHAAACDAFVKARDAEYTPDKAARVAAARARCSELRRDVAAAFCRMHGIQPAQRAS